MKKLMIAAAAAAMVGAAEASTQVYNMQLNMLTTTCAQGTIAANTNPYRTAAGVINYRTPASKVINGLIWMCECDYFVDWGYKFNNNVINNALTGWNTSFANYIAGLQPKGVVADAQAWQDGRFVDGEGWAYYVQAQEGDYYPVNTEPGTEGFIFWDASTGLPVFFRGIDQNGSTLKANWTPTKGTAPSFQWNLLQRIGAYAEQLEGAWLLEDSGSPIYALTTAGIADALTDPSVGIGPLYSLVGAGFGAVAANDIVYAAGYATADLDGTGRTDRCGNTIAAYMQGYFAGYVFPNAIGSTCVFCGDNGGQCTVWPFCACEQDKSNSYQTAAYGTWVIQYNANLSAALISVSSIRDIVTLNATTEEYIEWLEANRL